MKNKNEIIPYVRIDQVITFIKEVPSGESKVEELSDRFGRSSVQNLIPTLLLLGLCEYDKKNGIVKLTETGEKFRSALITNDEKKAAEMIKPYVDKSEVLSFVRILLEKKGSLSTLDIGRELAFKFNKKWDNILTYKTHGAACASILGFVGYGTYIRGILRKAKTEIVKPEISPPYAGFRKIVEIVRTISKYGGEVDLSTLSQRLGTKEGRLNVEIKNCIDLGFLERIAPGKIAITQLGREFINPLNKDRLSEIFRDALLYSGFNKTISSLPEVFDIKELGELLQHQLGAKWREDKTILTFGKKFLNWLASAELLEKLEEGKYRLKSGVVKESKKTPLRILSVTDYYKLGKVVGIILSSNNFENIKAAVEELLGFCKQDDNLITVAELLEEHYKLFLEIKDSRIFGPDIKLIEKTLGLKETIAGEGG